MGNVSINLSIANIWRSWHLFRQGKRQTAALHTFTYYLEKNLAQLHHDLTSGTYHHGGYERFAVVDKKRRDICVASLRDRVVHRLLYEYLTKIYDKTFIYDVWSCRLDKGLTAAIERTQELLRRYPNSFVWRADITKFFDSINQNTLLEILCRKIIDHHALYILHEVIRSYSITTHTSTHRERERERERETAVPLGMPIGNLTSQIFANIYFNEFDRYIKHVIKPQAYLRYGDDFIIIAKSRSQLEEIRGLATTILWQDLKLRINPKNDVIIPARRGLYFLGTDIFPRGRRLMQRNITLAHQRLALNNISSYAGLIKKHSSVKIIKQLNWQILEEFAEHL